MTTEREIFAEDFMLTLPTERYLAVKVVMMPRDTNAVGTIFGGVLLSYIDQAGAVGAVSEIRKQGWPPPALVTVAMNGEAEVVYVSIDPGSPVRKTLEIRR